MATTICSVHVDVTVFPTKRLNWLPMWHQLAHEFEAPISYHSESPYKYVYMVATKSNELASVEGF